MYLDVTVEMPDLKTGISKKRIKTRLTFIMSMGGIITLTDNI